MFDLNDHYPNQGNLGCKVEAQIQVNVDYHQGHGHHHHHCHHHHDHNQQQQHSAVIRFSHLYDSKMFEQFSKVQARNIQVSDG